MTETYERRVLIHSAQCCRAPVWSGDKSSRTVSPVEVETSGSAKKTGIPTMARLHRMARRSCSAFSSVKHAAGVLSSFRATSEHVNCVLGFFRKSSSTAASLAETTAPPIDLARPCFLIATLQSIFRRHELTLGDRNARLLVRQWATTAVRESHQRPGAEGLRTS